MKRKFVCRQTFFDIKNQKLDITSFNDKGINANLNLNEKGFRILKFKKINQYLKLEKLANRLIVGQF